MRTVTNKNIISMILLRTGTKSIRGLNYARTVTKRLSPYLMKSEKGIICQGPIPYDGREGMILRLSKRNQNSANLEDESEDDPRLLGKSHLKGTPSSLKIRRSELELKRRRIPYTCLRKAVQTGESLYHSYAGT